MKAQLADGRVLEFPDGTDPSVIQATVKKVLGGTEKPQEPVTQAEKVKDYQKGLKDIPTAELIASDPAYRAVKGAAMPLMGAAQYVGERVLDPAMQFAQENIVNPAREMVGAQPRQAPQPGDWITEQIRTGERLKQGGMEKTGQPQGLIDPYELAGGVVGGSAVTKGLPVAKTLIDKMLQSGSVSGLYGASMPTTAEDKDFDITKLKQMGTATALGGGLPVIGEGVRALGRGAGQLVRPFSKRGITKDTIDVFIEELGPQRARVANALSKAKRGETAGQTLARYGVENADDIGASVARLEKELSKKGGTGAPLREQYQTQEAGRKAVIDAIAGTDEDMAAALQARGAVDYPRAFEQKVNLESQQNPYKLPGIGKTVSTQTGKIQVPQKPVKKTVTQTGTITTPKRVQKGFDPYRLGASTKEIPAKTAQKTYTRTVQEKVAPKTVSKTYKMPSGQTIEQAAKGDKELSSIVNNPYFKDSIKTADKLSGAEGIKFTDNPTKYLHNIKIALDGKLERVGEKAVDKGEREAIRALKSKLINWIEKKNPEYKNVREEFIEKSIPINRMEIGRELQKRLSPVGKETPGTFQRAVADAPKTLKQSTGFARYNQLEDVLSPQQSSGVRDVAKQLEQNIRQRDMAGSVGAVLPKLERGIEVNIPNMLSRPALVANAILRGISKAKTEDYNRVATELVRNPKLLGQYLKNPPDAKTGEIARQIYNEILPVFSGQAAGMEESR